MMFDNALKQYYLKCISDESLLRLLTIKYDPLSPSHSDIRSLLNTDNKTPEQIQKDNDDFFALVDKVIIPYQKFDGLDKEELCRVLIYNGYAYPARENSGMMDYDVMIDVVVHVEYEKQDRRLAKISERIVKLFSNQHTTGIGKNRFMDVQTINVPNEFVGCSIRFRYRGGRFDI